jgi:hypothetical protein
MKNSAQCFIATEDGYVAKSFALNQSAPPKNQYLVQQEQNRIRAHIWLAIKLVIRAFADQ